MSTPSAAPEQRKSFAGVSPNAARDAASAWLRDFDVHGPLEIRSIRVSENGESFVATVVYTDAKIEVTPQHFPDYQLVQPSA